MSLDNDEIITAKNIDTAEYDYDYYNENDSDDVFDKNEDWNEYDNEQFLFETAFTIQNNLFDYVNYFALPLCEKLDVDSIIEFIKKSA